MRKGNMWRLVVAVVLATALVSGLIAVAHALPWGTGVSQVSVTGNATEILPNETITFTMTVLTGNSSEAWSGNITVNDGSTDHVLAITGTGTSTTLAKEFPTDWSTGDTISTGTYTVTARANGDDVTQTTVTGTASFEVKDFILSADATRIAPDGTTTITVLTNEAVWSATLTVTAPGGTATASVSNVLGASVVFPSQDFSGAGNDTTTAGVYTMALSAGATDTGTFDVQRASPHLGSFAATTDACAACHRAHTASGPKLLKVSSQYNLCVSCHDGTGANTKVTTGVYLGDTQGTQDAGLRAGGFVSALMDTDVDGAMSDTAITSKHSIGATNPVVWGSGTVNAVADAGEVISTLECGSCHNPHGNDNYRILRPEPQGLVADAAVGGVSVADESTTTYSISYDGSNYRDLGKYSTSTLSSVSNWCAQCHTRYLAGVGDGSSDSGDAIFAYSHMTDGLGGECFKCHVAHGTTSSMSSYATDPSWPGGNAASWQGSESDYSRLLSIDNRGVCLQCHTSTSLTQN